MTPHASLSQSLFYREIPLTQGQVALVDVEDYEWLSRYSWCAAWNEHMSSFYAIRSVKLTPGRKGKNYTMRMHREIMGLERGDPRKVDHREPSQTLDNRRFNLRIASNSQNMMNTRIYANNTTGFKGIYLVKSTGLFGAEISANNKTHFLGFYPTAEEANFVRLTKMAVLHGQFSRER
jgi:uncharacterized protein YegP (UPF0339 family)